MKLHQYFSHVGLAVLLASCAAAPAPAPAPVPPPAAVRPAPPPLPSASVADAGWEDRALTPGDWHYDPASNSAYFGVGAASRLASLRCENGQIHLAVPGLAAADGAILYTSAGQDPIPLRGGEVRLAAGDQRLDRIIFSRGRFAIEDAAGRALTLPSWAEIGRVVDDCRG